MLKSFLRCIVFEYPKSWIQIIHFLLYSKAANFKNIGIVILYICLRIGTKLKIPSEITPPLKLRAKKEVHQFLTIKIVKHLDEKLHIKARKIPDSLENKYYYCGYCLEGQRWDQYQSEDSFKKVAKNFNCELLFPKSQSWMFQLLHTM